MHYIRFLKSPSFVLPRPPGSADLRALITIVSDLGERFFCGHVTIQARLIDCNDGERTVQSKSFLWKDGMRQRSLDFQVSRSVYRDNLRLHVAVERPLAADAYDDVSTSSSLESLTIVSAWSCKIPRIHSKEQAKVVERRFRLASDATLCIWEETGESIACHIWDAGLMLTAYLAQCLDSHAKPLPLLDGILKKPPDKSLKAIELGSGCGMVGLGLTKMRLNLDMLLTDLAVADEIIDINRQANLPAATVNVDFQVLDWATELPAATGTKPLDLVLIADCTYNPNSAQSLVTTLARLVASSPGVLIVVAMKVRHPSEAVFFDLMDKAGLSQAAHTAIPIPNGEAPEASIDQEQVDIYAFKQGQIVV